MMVHGMDAHDDHYDELKRMDKNAQEDVPQNETGQGPQSMVSQEHTLDISSPDPFKIAVKEEKVQGITYRNCSINSCLNLSSIVAGKDVIWTAGVGEKCTFTRHSTKGSYALLTICIHSDNETSNKYYDKVGKEWNEIAREEFGKRTGSMMCLRSTGFSNHSTILIIIILLTLRMF